MMFSNSRLGTSLPSNAWELPLLFWARFGHLSDFRRKSPKNHIQKFLILRENFGAGDRGRTGDVQLGKLAFYR